MALMPPEERLPPVVGASHGFATAIYPPMYHIHNEPPIAPQMSRLRRPSLSIRKKSQMMVMMVLMTPKIPVVSREVFVPVMPIDLNLQNLSESCTF